VKSLGDGLMVAFASAADAVRCAIADAAGVSPTPSAASG
jgi:class 3 adenylate cyclase